MRTLTVKQGKKFEDKFPPGWHELTISRAKYGDFQDSKYIDVWFEEYSEYDKLSVRIWAKTGKDGEEFAIGRLFRFANAGIKSVSKSDEGDAIITIDDKPEELVDKKINVFFYKKGEKKYTEVLSNVAPTEFQNDLETFNANDVEFWKEQAEKYYKDYILDKDKGSNGVLNGAPNTHTAITDDSMDEIPW